jgi:aconitate hydratase
MDRKSVGLKGDEIIDITGLEHGLKPHMNLTLTINRANGARFEFDVLCRIDTLDEVEYFKHGGILHYVLRRLAEVA